MQNRYQTKLEIFEGRPDLTPLIDVVFLLLIFFMLSSSFVQVSGIPVVLPSTTKKASSDMSVNKLVVTINWQNKLFFNEKQIDWETLKQELQEFKLKMNADTVIVRADKRTEYGVVVRLMSLARSMELNVYVATVRTDRKQEKDYKDANPD